MYYTGSLAQSLHEGLECKVHPTQWRHRDLHHWPSTNIQLVQAQTVGLISKINLPIPERHCRSLVLTFPNNRTILDAFSQTLHIPGLYLCTQRYVYSTNLAESNRPLQEADKSYFTDTQGATSATNQFLPQWKQKMPTKQYNHLWTLQKGACWPQDLKKPVF